MTQLKGTPGVQGDDTMVAGGEAQEGRHDASMDTLASVENPVPSLIAGKLALRTVDVLARNVVMPTVDVENVDQNPALARFKLDYSKCSVDIQARCSWEEVERRLLANNARYLRLAEAMNEGGTFFGINQKGNPLFADAGDEPIMTGMGYKKTRDRVLFEHTSPDAAGEMILDEEGKAIPTGYQMFPSTEGHFDLSEEVKMYMRHGADAPRPLLDLDDPSFMDKLLKGNPDPRPFVQPKDRGDRRLMSFDRPRPSYVSSWIESGSETGTPPHWPKCVTTSPNSDISYSTIIREHEREYLDVLRGVRRMLELEDDTIDVEVVE